MRSIGAMRSVGVVVLLLSGVLAACGAKPEEPEITGASKNPALATLPATVEGLLDMSLGEGDDDDDGVDMLYGGLTLGNEDLFIQVDARLLDEAGIGEPTRVRATIGSSIRDGHDQTTYTITALTKL
jgi:hypothetical protein